MTWILQESYQRKKIHSQMGTKLRQIVLQVGMIYPLQETWPIQAAKSAKSFYKTHKVLTKTQAINFPWCWMGKTEDLAWWGGRRPERRGRGPERYRGALSEERQSGGSWKPLPSLFPCGNHLGGCSYCHYPVWVAGKERGSVTSGGIHFELTELLVTLNKINCSQNRITRCSPDLGVSWASKI